MAASAPVLGDKTCLALLLTGVWLIVNQNLVLRGAVKLRPLEPRINISKVSLHEAQLDVHLPSTRFWFLTRGSLRCLCPPLRSTCRHSYPQC